MVANAERRWDEEDDKRDLEKEEDDDERTEPGWGC